MLLLNILTKKSTRARGRARCHARQTLNTEYGVAAAWGGSLYVSAGLGYDAQLFGWKFV